MMPFSAIDFCQELIKDSTNARASDIHLEMEADFCRIRIRVDGLLQEFKRLTLTEASSVLNHLKVLSQLNIAEHRLPQDGRFSFKHSHSMQSRECRISCCPSLYGEKLVLRLLPLAQELIRLEDLGMDTFALSTLKSALKDSQGLILVTGPTGAGKSATLYAALNFINQPEAHIITIEDPVEIPLMGITQVSVNPNIGLNFSNAVRSFLRLDPDIMMIGEIRDSETAQAAVQAAQTGHLVLSTLHSHDPKSSFIRLRKLGIPEHDLNECLRLIISQRLVRKTCENCKGLSCSQCHQGYYGRTGVFSLLDLSTDKKPTHDLNLSFTHPDAIQRTLGDYHA